MRSFTIGTQPPQPVPALLHCFMPSTVVTLNSVTAAQMAPLVTASQEHTSASSGRLSTPAPPLALPSRAPSIRSSGCGGSTILLFTVCSNRL